MPPKKALELLMTGRRVSAAEGREIGFVSELVPDDEIDAAVNRIAASMASKPPAAMRLGRSSFYDSLEQAPATAFPLLQGLMAVTASTSEAKEGIDAFAQRRAPNWTNPNDAT
jgi:enoyl-CoA hydratase/carnithine racemase